MNDIAFISVEGSDVTRLVCVLFHVYCSVRIDVSFRMSPARFVYRRASSSSLLSLTDRRPV